MSEKTCPSCNKPSPELLRLDADLKGRLKVDAGITPPDTACPNCYNDFTSKLQKASHKKSRRIAKEQQRLNLWRSRVHLIREAREQFAIKNFPAAVVAYEKYFRVLEIIYEVKPNEIQATHFNNSARSKELVVIASAYWDLMRIYDQSPRFSNRLEQCAVKLSEFLPLTPIYGEILRKIEDYKKSAKNKDKFDLVAKMSTKGKRRCFIATAAFQDADAPTVVILSNFRDNILEQSPLGRKVTKLYYRMSPPVAEILDQSAILRNITRGALVSIAGHLDKKYSLKTKHPSK
ncbi:MAG: CFI-box-CTERM domain-containing protein [Oligoflexia bacterium]|nr:CFI-box-CTERM domain-containing protein [Oligoflexia bacterium]